MLTSKQYSISIKHTTTYKHFILFLFFFSALIGLRAEVQLPICGSSPTPGDRIVVFCDGSVLVDGADITGLSITAAGITVNIPASDIPDIPFLSTSINNGNFVTIDDNAVLTITTADCSFTQNISDILENDCGGVDDVINVETPCGDNFIKISCSGEVYIDLADDVFIYKVWNGGDLIAELNNFRDDTPDVITTPFLASDFGAIVPDGGNFYLDIQSAACGQQTINISFLLSQFCGFEYNTVDNSSRGLLVFRSGEDDFRDGKRNSIDQLSGKETGLVNNKVPNYYPNPVSSGSSLTVDLPFDAEEYKVALSDLNGRTLMLLNLPSGRQSINLPNTPAGYYRLVVSSPLGVSSSLLAIQR